MPRIIPAAVSSPRHGWELATSAHPNAHTVEASFALAVALSLPLLCFCLCSCFAFAFASQLSSFAAGGGSASAVAVAFAVAVALALAGSFQPHRQNHPRTTSSFRPKRRTVLPSDAQWRNLRICPCLFLRCHCPCFLVVIPEEPALSEVEWGSAFVVALALASLLSSFAAGGGPTFASAVAFACSCLTPTKSSFRPKRRTVPSSPRSGENPCILHLPLSCSSRCYFAVANCPCFSVVILRRRRRIAFAFVCA